MLPAPHRHGGETPARSVQSWWEYKLSPALTTLSFRRPALSPAGRDPELSEVEGDLARSVTHSNPCHSEPFAASARTCVGICFLPSLRRTADSYRASLVGMTKWLVSLLVMVTPAAMRQSSRP